MDVHFVTSRRADVQNLGGLAHTLWKEEEPTKEVKDGLFFISGETQIIARKHW